MANLDSILDKEKYEQAKANCAKGEMICGVCYKEFIKSPCNLYKQVYKGKTYHFCSYTCYRVVQVRKESKEDENNT